MILFLHHVMVVVFGLACGVFIYANLRRAWVSWNVQAQHFHYARYNVETQKYQVCMKWVISLSIVSIILYLLIQILSTLSAP